MIQNDKPGGNVTTRCLVIGICILLSHEGIEVLTPVVLVITCMGLKAGQAAIMAREESERRGRERERE